VNFYRKAIFAIENYEFFQLLTYVLLYPQRKVRILRIKSQIKNSESLERRFTTIYSLNLWGSHESKSGMGSNFDATTTVRSELPVLFTKFGIKSVLDAPCGDFHWMKEVDLTDIRYTGADIVKPLIQDLNHKYGKKNINFIHLDLTKEVFQFADLVINRDCLFHLSFEDTGTFLKNFLDSGSSYLLSTSYSNQNLFENRNISSGDFRLIDLFAPPYNFPKQTHYQIIEKADGALPVRNLYLWNREQILLSYSEGCLLTTDWTNFEAYI
jgi:hypothetical protein